MPHIPRRLLTGAGLALALLLSLITPLLVTGPAAAAGAGSISGRVLVQPTGGAPAAPTSTARVQLSYSATSSQDSDGFLDQFPAAADGAFSVTGLDDGWYWLRFVVPGYASEYYDNSNSAYDGTPVEVRGGAVVLANTAVLERSAAVVGRVTDSQGVPIAGASVGVFTSSSSGGQTVTTNANGEYDTRGALQLTPGSYHAEAGLSGNLDQPLYSTRSAQITLAADQVRTQNFVLAERPTVLVTVLGPDGRPLKDAPLSIQVKHPDFDNGGWGPIRYGPNQTDARGRYRFTDGFNAIRFYVGLPAGYKGAAAVGEWWNNSSTARGAQVLTFPAGVAVRRTITVQLTQGRLSATRPTVAGKARVSKVLTARAGAWGPAPVRLRYTWLRGTTPIKGATGVRYRLTRKDLGRRVSVRVTGTKPSFATVVRASAKTAKVKR